MLRKFHASYLKNAGMEKDDVNCLQGKSRNSTDESYFYDDPKILQEKYIRFMGAIAINLDVNNLDLKSPEYIELENENLELKEENEMYREVVDNIDERIESKIREAIGRKNDLSGDELEDLFS